MNEIRQPRLIIKVFGRIIHERTKHRVIRKCPLVKFTKQINYR